MGPVAFILCALAVNVSAEGTSASPSSRFADELMSLVGREQKAAKGSALSAGKAVVAAIEAANKGNYGEANRLLDVELYAAAFEGADKKTQYWKKLTKNMAIKAVRLSRERASGDLLKAGVKITFEDDTTTGVGCEVKLRKNTWVVKG